MNTTGEIISVALNLPPMSSGWSFGCIFASCALAFVTACAGACKRMKARGIKDVLDGAEGIEPLFFGFIFAVIIGSVAYGVSFWSWPWLALTVILSAPFVPLLTKLAKLLSNGVTWFIETWA